MSGHLDPEAVYSQQAASEVMGLPPSAFRAMCQQGLAVVYFRRRAFYRGSDLIDWLLDNGSDKPPGGAPRHVKAQAAAAE